MADIPRLTNGQGPQQKRDIGYAFVVTSLVLLGSNQPPPGQQLSASAPITKYQVQVTDPLGTPEVLRWPQITLPRSAVKLSDSAPIVKAPVYADNWRSLAVLGSNQPPQGQRADASAPPLKSPVYADNWRSLALLGSNQPPQGQALSASAPITKYQVFADNWRSLVLLGNNQFPPGQTLSTSAPIVKYAVVADNWRSLAVFGSNQPPTGQAALGAAPAAKPSSVADTSPNLLTTTLAVAAGTPIPLPLSAARLSDSAPVNLRFAYTGPEGIRYPPVAVAAAPFTLPLDPPTPRADLFYGTEIRVLTLMDQPTLLPLGAVRLDASAPVGNKPNVLMLPNRPQITFPPPSPPLSSVRLDTSAPIVKYQVIAENRGAPVTLGIPSPPPAVPLPLGLNWPQPEVPWRTSDPTAFLAVTTLQKGIAPSTDSIRAPLIFAAQPKYQVIADNYGSLALTTLLVQQPLPVGESLTTSAPPLKAPVQVDVYPNVVIRSGGLPLPPPISEQLSASAPWSTARQVVADQYVNTLALGINVIPAPPVLVCISFDTMGFPITRRTTSTSD